MRTRVIGAALAATSLLIVWAGLSSTALARERGGDHRDSAARNSDSIKGGSGRGGKSRAVGGRGGNAAGGDGGDGGSIATGDINHGGAIAISGSAGEGGTGGYAVGGSGGDAIANGGGTATSLSYRGFDVLAVTSTLPP